MIPEVRAGAYTVRVHSEDDGSVWAEVDDLPGCFASGESIDQLWGNLAEAIGLYQSDEYVRVEVKMQEPEPIVVHIKERRISVA